MAVEHVAGAVGVRYSLTAGTRGTCLSLNVLLRGRLEHLYMCMDKKISIRAYRPGSKLRWETLRQSTVGNPVHLRERPCSSLESPVFAVMLCWSQQRPKPEEQIFARVRGC